ncbi:uncharacterized protein BP01DRAFT_201974 [Aspergillus saccharolyticus JOP 1030-1]|uniref:Uncharacterized protein n=1 Tax=Aspergillus saccharolyticus JOP 1030-1 TaxID=1450539 RepID=A0A318Z7K0_9EURO|nr:hypothetical protein BP01DRAFT_201974 [Aspergillus saccharolyticus JOP 1030-1]PYH40733.1 hypothetical protein BP01DRAFT_201974 [Aspergillus saccharolyticus JOP 1030-1]
MDAPRLLLPSTILLQGIYILTDLIRAQSVLNTHTHDQTVVDLPVCALNPVIDLDLVGILQNRDEWLWFLVALLLPLFHIPAAMLFMLDL